MGSPAAISLAALFIVGGLLIDGCKGRASDRPTAMGAVRPALKEVELLWGIYLARLESRTTITADGRLRQVRLENKSDGPGISGVRIERREGRLTPEQMDKLAALFEGWQSLSGERYGGVPDGGHIRLRYGQKTVKGGSATPQVWTIQLCIDELAAGFPVVRE